MFLFHNSHTGCADNLNFADQVDCLRGLPAETVIEELPWQQWLNSHFYQIPTADETSTIIVTIDGRSSHNYITVDLIRCRFLS